MICYQENLLKTIFFSHVSEKSSYVLKRNNVIVFQVKKESTKKEIKKAIEILFKVKVKQVHTLLVKGKSKRYGKYYGKRKNWKKAYVTLEKNQNLDFIKKIE